MQAVTPQHIEKIDYPPILADFKEVLSQHKKACVESNTPNVPFACAERIGYLSPTSISRPPSDGVIKLWAFSTKPQFKRLEKLFREPGTDVFDEATEVQIIIDLGSFRRGEIEIDTRHDKYTIFAKEGNQEFREEIVLPPNVDTENIEEYFRNDILQIILQKKREKPWQKNLSREGKNQYYIGQRS